MNLLSSRLQVFSKENRFFILIFILALVIRIYRIDELSTFGRDQGIDFLTVKDMIIHHKLTLIGIKTSVGDFYQGPLYLFILLPFFFIFNLSPIAGSFAAVFIAAFTLILIYITVTRFFSKKLALISTTIYAFSPQFIIFGNTPLYQHFLPLFIVISITIYLFMTQYKSSWLSLLLGVTNGLGMELHLLTISLVLSYVLLLIYTKRYKHIPTFIIGLIFGLLPSILFELRHQFLNTHLFLNYFQKTNGSHLSILNLLMQWENGAAVYFAGFNNFFGGIFLLVLVLLFLFRSTNKQENALLHLTVITFIITGLLSIKFSAFQAHYLLPLWVTLIIFAPIVIQKILPKVWSYTLFGLYLVVNLVWIMQSLPQNHGYYMPSGWTMKNILKTASIIKTDSHKFPSYNIASLLDGDTRSYPLRYSLEIMHTYPSSVDSYPKSEHLYVLTTPKRSVLSSEKVWEITSMGPAKIEAKWKIAPSVILYRIDKINK